MKRVCEFIIIIILLVIISCGKQHSSLNLTPNDQSNKAAIWGLDTNWQPFPAMPNDRAIPNIGRTNSAATDPIPGINYVASKGSLNRNDETISNAYIIISDKNNRFAYAQYVAKGFTGDRPVSLSVNINQAKYNKSDSKYMPTKYMVGIANFTKYSWEWFGPYTTDTSITINDLKHRDRYLSPANNIHFVITTYINNSNDDPVGISIVDTKCNVSSTSVSTRPIYTPVNYLHIGQNIVDPTVKMTSAIVADQYINIYWYHLQPLNPEDAPTYYTVYMKAPTDTQPLQIGKIKAPTSNELVKFVVPTNVDSALKDIVNAKLEGGKTYSFALKAENSLGTTILSKLQSIYVPSILPPTEFFASNDKTTGIELKWKPATNATGYKIYRDKQDNLIATVGNVSNYTDTNVNDNQTYTYWLKSINDKPEQSGFSASAQGKKLPGNKPLAPPKDLVASTDRKDGILLTWVASPFAKGYEIYRDKQDAPLFTAGATTSFLDDTVTDLADHTYWVKATAPGYPTSDFSNPAVGRMLSGGGEIPAPTNVKASTDNLQGIFITWNKVPGATEYAIYRDKQTNQIVKLGNLNSYLDDSITDYDEHTYWIKAYDGYNKSDFSEPAVGKRGKSTTGDIYEPDNFMEEAKLIVPSNTEQKQFRSIEPKNDEDWVKFNGNPGETIYFWSTGSTDVDIAIYDSSFSLLVYDDDSGGYPNFYVEFTPTSPGTYYARINTTLFFITGEYTFHFVTGEPPLLPPSGLYASTDMTDGIYLTWNKSKNATGYEIYRDTKDVPITTTGDEDNYFDPVSDYKNHEYWVKAINPPKSSDFSTSAIGKRLKELGPDIYEDDDTLEQAKEIIPKASTTTDEHSLYPDDDQDWCKFDAEKDSWYTFYSVNTKFLTIIAYIKDKYGKELYKSENQWGDFRIDWQAPSTSIYFLHIHGLNPADQTWYELNYYKDGVLEAPKNLTASTDKPYGIDLNWDAVTGATEYLIFRDNQNTVYTTAYTNSYTDKPSDHNKHTYWVKAKKGYDESPFSNSAIGEKPADTNPDWEFETLNQEISYDISAIVLSNGNPAFIYNRYIDKNEIVYFYANTPKPTGITDWNYYVIDKEDPHAPQLALINNKPALVCLKFNGYESNLIYWYAKNNNPTSASDWSYCNIFSTDSTTPSLAQVNGTASIVFSSGNTLKYAVASSPTPTNADWNIYDVINEWGMEPHLSVQPNGNPAFVYNVWGSFTSFDLKYIYSTKTVPTQPSDWVNMKIAFDTSYTKANLVFVNSAPAISYSIYDPSGNSNALHYIYSTINPPTSKDWIDVEVDPLAGNYLSLNVVNNLPAISYTFDTWGPTTPYLRYAEALKAQPKSSADWKIVNVDSDGGGSTGLISISNQPNIFYIWSEANTIKHARRIK